MLTWFKKMSFRKKLLSTYFVFIGLSFILSFIFCLNSMEMSERESSRYMRQFAEQADLNMNVIFSNMDRIRFLHLIDDKVRPMIRTSRESKPLSRILEEDDYVTRTLNHMTNMNQYILRAVIVNEYGDVYSNIQTEDTGYLDRLRKIEASQDWEDKHKIYYTGVYTEAINLVDYPLVTGISKLYDIDGDEPIGTVYIDLNFSAVRQILDSTLESQRQGHRLMIFDTSGDLIYHTGSNGEGLWGRMSDEEKSKIERIVKECQGTALVQDLTIKDESVTGVIMENEETGWKLLAYTPLTDIYTSGVKNMAGIVVVTVVLLILAGVLGVLLAGQISRPVTMLAKAMDNVDQGKVKYIDAGEYYWQDEMGYLMRCYNQMGRRINDSIEKIYIYQLNQKQTELKMLQFQINPHFLYNTLNTISSIASLEGIPEIVQISDNLSNMFKYNVTGKDIVPLEQEITHVKNYMGIQAIRFPGKYEFRCLVPPELSSQPVLKFLLQPLVENSLKHAFEKMKDINRVTVEGRMAEENIMISIYDNGIGMPPEQVDCLNCELEKMDTRTLVTNVDKGIGLRNVNARIKNFYGQECGILVESLQGEYTRIQIRIRKMAVAREDEHA